MDNNPKPEENSEPSPAAKKRKRTGEKKNQPAGRGFYGDHFRALESADLAAVTDSLEDEIVMLRVASRRAFEFASENEPGDLKEWATVLASLGMVSTRIANLIKIKAQTEGGKNDEQNTISQVLADVVRELGCK
jgi:predicted lactoylglutathione lyase